MWLGFVRNTARKGSFWIAFGLVVHFAAYQYQFLGFSDLFWFRMSAIALVLYAIGTRLMQPGIVTAIFVGLTINNLAKELFGTPTQFNVYDYYGAAVTVALIIYEQAKTKTDDSDGHRSISANGR